MMDFIKNSWKTCLSKTKNNTTGWDMSQSSGQYKETKNKYSNKKEEKYKKNLRKKILNNFK